MSRVVFALFGALEFAVAGVLAVLGWALSPGQVHEGFAKAEQVTRNASSQVHLLNRQVRVLRQPEVLVLTQHFQAQTRTVTEALRNQQIDFDTIRNLDQSLGEVAGGLDKLADTLQGTEFTRLSDGLGETAKFIDGVISTANATADDLDRATTSLQADANQFNLLVREAPLDLKAARQIHDSLAHFGEGLNEIKRLFREERLDAMRDGFAGMEEALDTGADQVERLSRYTYPAVSFSGLKPEVSQKPFWPDGDTIAKGLRKAATGVSAAEEEMANLIKGLPQLRSSLNQSGKVVDQTRQALSTALRQQDKLEAILKDLPARANSFAEQLPAMSKNLSRLLRETQKLKDVSAALQKAEQGVVGLEKRWPEFPTTLTRTAAVLRATRAPLKQVVQNRKQYETARQEMSSLGESIATTLPLVSEQLDLQVHEQERALGDLGQSIDEVGAMLPAYSQAANRLLISGRVLAWLVAGIVAMHALYLAIGIGVRPQDPGLEVR